jgi:4a-hydroxytetrahydrobiopterin dehydratase
MDGWEETGNSLRKTFTFDSFNQAIAWMQEAAIEVDALNHHPSWTNVYNRVEVELTTHDAGNTVTEKDHQLANILDQCYRKFS